MNHESEKLHGNLPSTSPKPRTRKMQDCPVFGTPTALSKTVLPTYENIMKSYMLVRYDIQTDGRKKEPTVGEIAEIVTLQVEELWKMASIPVISHQRILERVRDYHDKYRKLLKPLKGRSQNLSYNEKIRNFKKESEKLFDVAACKCYTSICCCVNDRKVPVDEREFLADQRGARKMMIGSVDFVKTKKLQLREKRKQEDYDRVVKHTKSSQSGKKNATTSSMAEKVHEDSDDSIETNAAPSENEDDKNMETATPDLKPSQMRKRLPTFARECDRWGASDRSAAAIASAIFQDIGIIDEQDSSSVIDRNKVRRERQKLRNDLKVSLKGVQGLYFDGRKDKTRHQVLKNGVNHPVVIVEEHIVLVNEPGSEYIGHISPPSGTAACIAGEIIKFLAANRISVTDLVAVGCDGTNVNTGVDGGIIRLLENHFKQPLHWFVCLLHMNELPLRHLLVHLDGVTHGPKSYSGPIGKALETCVQPITSFKSIQGNILPEVDVKDLSSDQRYLYNMCLAVTSGLCSQQLADMVPGPLAHSRWLTAASRILRLYVATDEPSMKLTTLVTYIVKVYAPMWFEIKTKSSCSDGARHVWKMISYSRYLDDDLKAVVDTVIQRNAFFAHSENILLAMISDEREHIRKVAFRRIMAARAVKEENSAVRRFVIPTLNFAATEYSDMINWMSLSTSNRFEPQLTSRITQEDLEGYASQRGVAPCLKFPKWPCHSQAVERCVRLVTEASSAVCGCEQRDGFIRARLESRAIMPQFNVKSDYRMK